MPAAFLRKNIRLPRRAYLGCTICFATLCFDQRRNFALDPAFATWLIDFLRSHAAREFFLIHAYCVMPDHLHFLSEGTYPSADTRAFANHFKQLTGYAFTQRRNLRLRQPMWCDHLVRPNESIEAVCWYIWTNPVRRKLCLRPVDYPFLGSFSDCGSRICSTAPDFTWQPPWKVPA